MPFSGFSSRASRARGFSYRRGVGSLPQLLTAPSPRTPEPLGDLIRPEAARMGQARALEGLICQHPAGWARKADERGSCRHSSVPDIPPGLRIGARSQLRSDEMLGVGGRVVSLHLHLVARWLSSGLPGEPSGHQKFGDLGRQTLLEPLSDSPTCRPPSGSSWSRQRSALACGSEPSSQAALPSPGSFSPPWSLREPSGKHSRAERLWPCPEHLPCLMRSIPGPSLCQMILTFHTPCFSCGCVTRCQEGAGESREPTKAQVSVTWSQLAPPSMAKAVFPGRACWACSRLMLGSLASSCSLDTEPGQEHQASGQIGAAPQQPTHPGGTRLWDKHQGNGALKPVEGECRGLALQALMHM